jgi:pimeloyl-ACP methyl ester carboxylesterase
LANDPEGIVEVVKGVVFRKSNTENLSSIKQPVLILYGDKDELTVKQKSEILHKNIENSSLEIIPGAGHMSPVEEPKLVNQKISSFINSL